MADVINCAHIGCAILRPHESTPSVSGNWAVGSSVLGRELGEQRSTPSHDGNGTYFTSLSTRSRTSFAGTSIHATGTKGNNAAMTNGASCLHEKGSVFILPMVLTVMVKSPTATCHQPSHLLRYHPFLRAQSGNRRFSELCRAPGSRGTLFGRILLSGWLVVETKHRYFRAHRSDLRRHRIKKSCLEAWGCGNVTSRRMSDEMCHTY